MYNSDSPYPNELPSSRKLIRSTLIALVSAVILLVTIILPSEYGIDPTGVGRSLGLTEMGEIKTQLAKEAEADRQQQQNLKPAELDKQSSLIETIFSALLIRSAVAQTTSNPWKDEIKITLKPGQGAEVKLVMTKGAKAQFAWTAVDGVANYDLHGDGSGKSISYKKGRGVPGDEGVLEAAFDGNHGWFWRNRTRKDIAVILRVNGDYSEMKRVL
jgi:hypothetical protein